MYDPEKMPVPSSVPREGTKDISYEDIKKQWAYYYGCISFVDDQFGRLLENINRLGLSDNTVVVYISDHGNLLGQHNLFGKQFLYDDDARVPFIIRYPGQPKQGIKIDALVEQVDVMPTLLDILDISIPRGVQGKSLVPLMDGKGGGREAVFGFMSNEFNAPSRQMIRTKVWKLILTRPEKDSMLFDLANDPLETKNLYGKSEYREKELELKTKLLSWHLDTVDTTLPSTFHDEDAKQWVENYLEPTISLKWQKI